MISGIDLYPEHSETIFNTEKGAFIMQSDRKNTLRDCKRFYRNRRDRQSCRSAGTSDYSGTDRA